MSIDDALAERYPERMIVRWAMVVETIDEDGEPVLNTVNSEGTTPWGALGLLQFGADVSRPNASATVWADDED